MTSYIVILVDQEILTDVKQEISLTVHDFIL